MRDENLLQSELEERDPSELKASAGKEKSSIDANLSCMVTITTRKALNV